MTTSRRAFLTGATAGAAALAVPGQAQATYSFFSSSSSSKPMAVVAWNRALTAAIAATATQATVAARAIAMLNEAIYNAWAHYDYRADFTLSLYWKRPFWEWTDTWKSVAISQAAHDVLVDLFPSEAATADALLESWVARWRANWSGGVQAVQVGQAVARALLAARRHDGANQYGTLAPGAYADWTGYMPVNTPDLLIDPTRWQPLRVVNRFTGVTEVQQFLTPQWGRVKPFALSSGSVYRPQFGDPAPTDEEMQELIDISAALDDNSKSLVEAWAANPGTVSPPGQWIVITDAVAIADRNTLDEDVKLFFAVGQALFDASIAAWDAKRHYDSVRPISAIRHYFKGRSVRAWGGPYQGTQTILADQWLPYQRPTNSNPPFAEFPSGHSTFSAAASTVLKAFRGDSFTVSWTIKAGDLSFELTTPANPVTLSWPSFSAAAAAAGMSRRVGGIHFIRGDLDGRTLGRQVGEAVWSKCRRVFS